MHKKTAAYFLSALICLTLASCGDKKNNSSSEIAETTVSGEAATQETSAESTEAPADTTENEKPTETKADTTEATTTAPTESSDGTYSDSLSIAKTFYKAYLEHDPETVYNMFNEDEIELYKSLIKDTLQDQDPEEVFSKNNVIDAINESMNAVDTIIDAYTDSPDDKWKVDVTDEVMSEVKKDELKEFNDALGTDYSKGVIIQYIDYTNTSNEESFTGNSSAFLEKDGKWYLSYSSLMQSDLLNYLEV